MRLDLPGDLRVDLVAATTTADPAWNVEVTRGDGHPATPADGLGSALVALLREGGALPEGWQLLRLAAPPRATAGSERPITVDQTHRSSVLAGAGGEGRDLVVKWIRSVADRPQPALSSVAQLAAVGFAQAPATYAVLTCTSPRGHVLPVAYVTEYLPGASDGWTWCVELVAASASGEGYDEGWADLFPVKLGALTAELHVALSTPSRVFARPVQTAGPTRPPRWYDGAIETLQAALDETTDPETARILRDGAEAITRTFDDGLGDLEALANTPVQHIHGDLHVGQVLLWDDGLAVVDFDGNPVAPPDPSLLHPAARDVAQMLSSLDHVGQIVLHRRPEVSPVAVRRWLATCGDRFLEAYRETLAERGFEHLLDERLLPAFWLEQELRDVRYAARHLPRWAFAPRGSLRDLVEGVHQ